MKGALSSSEDQTATVPSQGVRGGRQRARLSKNPELEIDDQNPKMCPLDYIYLLGMISGR